MAKRQLPNDFKEFLKLLNAHEVRYLFVGGHAVGAHGYPRNTEDIDVWIACDRANADRIVDVLREFGFGMAAVTPEVFMEPNKILRMGRKPMLVEIHTTLSGVDFGECFERREIMRIDELDVPVIGLADLRTNKVTAGLPKDLADLEGLRD